MVVEPCVQRVPGAPTLKTGKGVTYERGSADLLRGKGEGGSLAFTGKGGTGVNHRPDVLVNPRTLGPS